MLANTTIITPTYQFIDTLTHHIFVQVKDHQRTPDVSLWPGEGIYDIAIINENQLILVFPTLKMADGSLLNVPEYQILQLRLQSHIGSFMTAISAILRAEWCLKR
jgi:hypothetical protein